MASSTNTISSQSMNDVSIDHHDTAAIADINYRFDFARFFEHLVDVSLSFTATSDVPQLWLPAWIPGSYLMREFARNITAVSYQVRDNKTTEEGCKPETHRAQKIDKHTWQLPAVSAGQTVVVTYEVYCYDLSATIWQFYLASISDQWTRAVTSKGKLNCARRIYGR